MWIMIIFMSCIIAMTFTDGANCPQVVKSFYISVCIFK